MGGPYPLIQKTFSYNKHWTFTEWNQHQNSFCLVNPNISVSSQANEQSMCSSCVNYNFFFYFKYRKCEQNINLIVNSMISDWECLEILMHSMKDPQWVKYLPFKNDLYGAVFQVLIWKYRERLCWSTVVKLGEAYDIMCCPHIWAFI